MSVINHEALVKPGKWRTVQWVFGASMQCQFRNPAGTRVKVRYGVGWFGKDRQKRTLDGVENHTLSVGRGASFTRARFQVRVDRETVIRYTQLLADPLQ